MRGGHTHTVANKIEHSGRKPQEVELSGPKDILQNSKRFDSGSLDLSAGSLRQTFVFAVSDSFPWLSKSTSARSPSEPVLLLDQSHPGRGGGEAKTKGSSGIDSGQFANFSWL